MKLNAYPSRCPVCPEALSVVELACPACQTQVRGHFALPPLAQLSSELQYFALVFLLCRGNIREVEKELGISYPTVRNRLESVIEALGRAKTPPEESNERLRVMRALERGELTAAEAIARLEAMEDER